MKLAAKPATAPREDSPVTMLELFFDLVFVFVVTQITTLIGPNGWAGYGQAALVLAVTWYLYNGFAWLANNVAPTTVGTRLPMFAAMACFLAMAVVVPDVFGSGAWVFGFACLALVVIHTVQFARSSLGGSAQAIRRVVPINVTIAGLTLVSAAVGPTWGWLAWCAAVAVAFLAAIPTSNENGPQFSLRAHHFAERHHLLVIIALGETIIQIGQGAASHLTEPPVAAAFFASLTLISALWWVYYGTGDDTRGAHAFSEHPADRRGGVGARAYTMTHLVHIMGLVLCAAGLRSALHRPLEPLGAQMAVTMSAGVALFLLAQGASRAALRIGPFRAHVVAASAVLVASFVGISGPAVALLGVLAAMVMVLAWRLSRTA